MSDEKALVINGVSKSYALYQNKSDRLKEVFSLTKKVMHSTFYALNDVSFSVGRGETVGIIGRNGSGKSTLLKIITGVISATSGSVEVNGRVSALLELGAGFNQEYTGLQNIYLNGMLMGYSHDEMAERLDAILDFADIGDYVYQPVKTYSSGMFMRLAFAVAINVDPDILIVDEALAVGDMLFQAKCYKKFNEFKKMGRTILFVTHAMDSVLRYCDRVVVLSHGEKIGEGAPPEMVDLYKQLLVSSGEMVVKEKEGEAKNDLPAVSEALEINSDALEYGTKEAEIIDFGVFDDQGKLTNIIDGWKPFKVWMKVKFNSHKRDPILAFMIKDIKGMEITGTNTMFEHIDTGEPGPGDIIEVSFTQTLHLPPRDGYLLCLGCTGYEGDEFVVYHRLYDVIGLQFVLERNHSGVMHPDSEVELKAYKN